jgi:hypothetical protein
MPRCPVVVNHILELLEVPPMDYQTIRSLYASHYSENWGESLVGTLLSSLNSQTDYSPELGVLYLTMANDGYFPVQFHSKDYSEYFKLYDKLYNLADSKQNKYVDKFLQWPWLAKVSYPYHLPSNQFYDMLMDRRLPKILEPQSWEDTLSNTTRPSVLEVAHEILTTIEGNKDAFQTSFAKLNLPHKLRDRSIAAFMYILLNDTQIKTKAIDDLSFLHPPSAFPSGVQDAKGKTFIPQNLPSSGYMYWHDIKYTVDRIMGKLTPNHDEKYESILNHMIQFIANLSLTCTDNLLCGCSCTLDGWFQQVALVYIKMISCCLHYQDKQNPTQAILNLDLAQTKQIAGFLCRWASNPTPSALQKSSLHLLRELSPSSSQPLYHCGSPIMLLLNSEFNEKDPKANEYILYVLNSVWLYQLGEDQLELCPLVIPHIQEKLLGYLGSDNVLVVTASANSLAYLCRPGQTSRTLFETQKLLTALKSKIQEYRIQQDNKYVFSLGCLLACVEYLEETQTDAEKELKIMMSIIKNKTLEKRCEHIKSDPKLLEELLIKLLTRLQRSDDGLQQRPLDGTEIGDYLICLEYLTNNIETMQLTERIIQDLGLQLGQFTDIIADLDTKYHQAVCKFKVMFETPTKKGIFSKTKERQIQGCRSKT